MSRFFYTLYCIPFFLLLSLTAQGQGLDVEWGPELAGRFGTSLLNHLGEHGDSHFVLTGNPSNYAYDRATGWQGSGLNRNVQIQSFDAQFNLLASHPVEAWLDGRRLNPEYGFLKDGEITLLFSQINRDINRYTVYKQVQQIDAWQQNALFTELASFEFSGVRPQVRIAQSADRSVVYAYLPFRRLLQAPYSLGVVQLNSRFEANWTAELPLPETWSSTSIHDHAVADNGDLFLLAQHRNRPGEWKIRGGLRQGFGILKVEASEHTVKVQEVESNGKLLRGLQMVWASDGRLAVAGLYSSPRTFGTEGTFFTRINPQDLFQTHPELEPYDIEHLARGVGQIQEARLRKRVAKNKVPRASNLVVRDFMAKPNGGFLLTTEVFFINEVAIDFDDDDCPTDFEDEYNYNNISVFCLSEEGEVDWANKIQKRQRSCDEGFYSSFASFYDGNELHLVFNDHQDNLYREEGRFPRNFQVGRRNGVIVVATVHQDGSYTLNPLAENAAQETIAQPRLCVQTGSKELLVYGKRGRKLKLGKVVAP